MKTESALYSSFKRVADAQNHTAWIVITPRTVLEEYLQRDKDNLEKYLVNLKI